MSFLDNSGVTHLWGKIKAKFVPLDEDSTINGDITVNGDIGADQLNGNACNAAQINISGTTSTSIQTSGGITAAGNISAANFPMLLEHVNSGWSVSGASGGTIAVTNAYKYGRVIIMYLKVTPSKTWASGGSITATISQSSGYLPVITSDGVGYVGSHAVIGRLTSAGGLTCRNASTTSISSGSDGAAIIPFTYIY